MNSFLKNQACINYTIVLNIQLVIWMRVQLLVLTFKFVSNEHDHIFHDWSNRDIVESSTLAHRRKYDTRFKVLLKNIFEKF